MLEVNGKKWCIENRLRHQNLIELALDPANSKNGYVHILDP